MTASIPDETSFAETVERHRRELRVHCYRMLGSFDDAEDMVQEAILRAWRRRSTFEGRATFRAWLYRIATNVCLDYLSRHPRQPATRPGGGPAEVAWLQPFPDRLLEPAAPSEDEPDAAVVSKETIELAFMVALQHLPPRQRGVLVLRDVVGWPASDTGAALEMSVASVKSALQRARATLRRHLPEARHEWQAPDATDDERAILQRFVEANERADLATLAELVREDAWQTMPPDPIWFDGRAAMLAMWSAAMAGPDAMGEWRLVPTFANRQPAAANYLRAAGDPVYRASNLDVLRIQDGRIAEITTFSPELFAAFGLPDALPAQPTTPA
jgi:RNA polymerase sigma-70 factor (ECF subfamily)